MLLPVVVGLVMCFYGGHFYTLIAAAEAYQMVGYESTLIALGKLRDILGVVYEAEMKDLQNSGKITTISISVHILLCCLPAHAPSFSSRYLAPSLSYNVRQ